MNKWRLWAMLVTVLFAVACLFFSSVTIVRGLFERDRLRAELPEMRQEKEMLSPSILQLRADQGKLQGAMSIAQTNYNALQADTRIQEGLRNAALAQRDEAAKEFKEFSEKFVSLKAELSTNKMERQKLQREIESLGEDKQAKESELQKISQGTELKKKAYDAYAPRIAAEAVRLQTLLTDVGAATNALEKATRENVLLQKQKQEAEGKLLDLQQKVAKESQALEDLSNKSSREEESLSTAKAEKNAILGRIAKLKEDERELIPVTARLAQANKDIETANQELKKVDAALAEAESKLRQTKNGADKSNQPKTAK